MYKKYIPQSGDYEIRPLFRLLGATLMSFLAYILVIQAIPIFSEKNLQLSECNQHSLSKRLMCEFGNWLASKMPNDFQGPTEAISRILFAGIMLYLSWLLLKPLIAKLLIKVPPKHG